MQNHELREQDPPLKYDNTLGSSYESCPRRFYFQRRGFTYRGKPSYFAFGSAWGIFQGIWHSSEGPHSDPGSKEWELSFALALSEALEYWDLSGAEDIRNDSRGNLQALILRYVENYSHEPWKMVKEGAERGWLWPLEGSPYFLGGSIDGQLYWEGLGSLFKEDKTTGVYLNDQYIRQWNFANQVTGYIWYGRKLYGEEFFGVLMDMASKQITKAGKTPLFGRVLETRSEDKLREFEADWLHRIHRIEDSWNRWHWPKAMNPIECTGGLGRSQCLFQRVCLSDMHFSEVNPLQFDNIVLDETPWEPWNWTDPRKELEGMKPSETNSV